MNEERKQEEQEEQQETISKHKPQIVSQATNSFDRPPRIGVTWIPSSDVLWPMFDRAQDALHPDTPVTAALASRILRTIAEEHMQE